MPRPRHELLELLRSGVSRIEDISVRLDVSPSTVRRALSDLEREGQVLRTYGGAVLAGREPTWEEKHRERAAAKAAIADIAASLVEDDTMICLDAGTTTFALAERLRNRRSLTVVTTGVETASALRGAPGVEVILSGGRLLPRSGMLVGPVAEATLDRCSFTVAFLGADGIDPVRGLNTRSFESAAVKERQIRSARRVVVLADSSKLLAASYDVWIPLERDVTVVTDDGITDEQRTLFDQNPRFVLRVATSRPAGELAS
jgi:DeoR/GlpR family transcriptional regulator of sugar metabolism